MIFTSSPHPFFNDISTDLYSENHKPTDMPHFQADVILFSPDLCFQQQITLFMRKHECVTSDRIRVTFFVCRPKQQQHIHADKTYKTDNTEDNREEQRDERR